MLGELLLPFRSMNHMTRLCPWGSGPLLLCVACGPSVSASTGGGSGDGATSSPSGEATTEGAVSESDSDATTSESGGPGGTEEEPEQTSTVRAIYDSPQGVEYRDVVDGVIGEPHVLVSEDWSVDLFWDDSVVAARPGNFVIANWRDLDAAQWTVQFPTENNFTLTKVDDTWRLAEFETGGSTSGLWAFQIGPDGPTPPASIYALGQGAFYGGSGPYFLVKEFDETGAGRFARLPYEPGAEPETVFSFEDEATIAMHPIGDGDALRHLVYETETTRGGWSPQVWLIDVAAAQPNAHLVPRLPGAQGHAITPHSAGLVHPDGNALVMTQGNDEGQGDLVRVTFDGTALSDPVRLSTGASQGFVRLPSALDYPVFDTDGHWLAYVAHPADGPSQVFVMSWPDGEPIAVSEESRGILFAPDGRHLYFLSGPASSLRLARVALTDGVVGPEETIDSPAPGSTLKMSTDGSTLGLDSELESQVWLVDLTTTPPDARRIYECDGWDVTFRLSDDGSVLSCGSTAEYSDDREYVLVAVDTGETVPLDTNAALRSP